MKLIAETAWHHDGNFEFFNKLVDEILNKTKANYIKFHITLDVDEYMHHDHPGYDWAKERIFTKSQWSELFEKVIANGKKLMLLFNDKEAIDFGMTYNPELVEIHSVCLNDIKLLKHLKNKINNTTKIVLGVGGTDIYEVENAIEVIGTKKIVLMHGFQNYPTNYNDINFSKIRRLMSMYLSYSHGYADHTAWDNENNSLITLLGASLGMDYIEKHVTIETGEGRTDWQAAIDIESFNGLSEKLEILEQANGDGYLKMNDGEKAYSTFGAMKKAAILSKDVKKGDILTLDSFEFKRTGQSSDLSQLKILNNIGNSFVHDLIKGHCINKKDIEQL